MWSYLKSFHHDERGSLSVEMALVAPMLVWTYLAMFVFFDAYRTKANATKATYTFSDLLSRELDYVNPTYMMSMQQLFNFMTESPNTARIRLTMVRFDEGNNQYRVNWSKERGGVGVLNTTSLAQIHNQLPVMPDGEVVILFESWLDFMPSFNVGLEPFTIYNHVVTRPRFAPQVCWEQPGNLSNNWGGDDAPVVDC